MFIMIQLKNVLAHHLSLSCKCSHSRLLSVLELVEAYGADITIDQVRKNARCTSCNTKGGIEIRIVYVGGSHHAMEGSNTQERK